MKSKYFDEFSVGDCFETETRIVSEEEIIRFATDFDPQSFHTDPVAAMHSRFEGLIASGMHTLSLSMGQFFRHGVLDGNNLGSPGMDELRFLKPLRPGDAIRQQYQVTDLMPSRNKADRGVITMQHDTLNQHDDIIMAFRCMHIVVRRT
jgi:acyl dehydratase